MKHPIAKMTVRLATVVTQPVFIGLTVIVHGLIALGATAMVVLERNNADFSHWFDGLYWAFSTVTTVGYGDIAPLSVGGRLVAIGLMILGSTATALYAALFASAILSPELEHVERKIKALAAHTPAPKSGQ